MKHRWQGAVVAAVLVAAVLVAGSAVYWYGEGQPGTPGQFRDRVSATGLVVDWHNNGPRGGDGSVATDCGPVDVAVDEIDGELWIRWAESRERITPASIGALVHCSQ